MVQSRVTLSLTMTTNMGAISVIRLCSRNGWHEQQGVGGEGLNRFTDRTIRGEQLGYLG